MLRFKCLGIPVRVEPFFWVTMGVLGVLNATSRSGSSPQDLLLVALFMLAGFISILVHEMGHGIAAILAGGYFQKFIMHPDGSGIAYSGGVGTIGRAFVALGGLIGPAVVAGVAAAAVLHCTRRPSLGRRPVAVAST